jgi:hypothetical protein
MTEIIFMSLVIIIFLYFVYQQYIFQKGMFFATQEGFTPQQVNNVIQPPGSSPIGTADSEYMIQTQLLTVSNGYTAQTINNLKPSNPQPFSQGGDSDDNIGDFPGAELENKTDPLRTTEFEFPNDYKFNVEYKCRKTATGMFSDCGVYSANTAWTADPYKGLNCPLSNTKSPVESNYDTSPNSNNRETAYKPPSKMGISSIGNSMLR